MAVALWAAKPFAHGADSPNLNGIWQASSSAAWNIEPHPAYEGPQIKGDAFDAARAGLGIVRGGEIPYQPWARLQQQANFAARPA